MTVSIDTGFVMLRRNKEIFNLLRKRPSTFLLLTLIALRARRTTSERFDGLEIGEALIGDFDSYGATEQVYKTDKRFLERYGIVTFKPTTKGTIAKLISSEYFDINPERVTNEVTSYQRTANEQATTNNNGNNAKNENIKSRLIKTDTGSQSHKEENQLESPDAEANETKELEIAVKETSKGKYQITNPKTFNPSTEGEAASQSAWKSLEPNNPIALGSTYLWAYKQGLPAHLFYQFVSEIKQDSTVKNSGAVFRKKVEDWLSRKDNR